MPTIRLSSQARKSLRRLARSDRRLFQRVDRVLDRVAQEPEVGKPLQGPLQGHRSWRVGSVRIVYRLLADQLVVFVLDVAQRGKIYRDLL